MCVSQELRLAQHLEQSQRQVLRIGETSGDIPIYSLHRIRGLMRRRPIGVSGGVLKMLVHALVRANNDYRAKSGNKWNCLTSQNLVDALEGLDSALCQVVDTLRPQLKELLNGRRAIETLDAECRVSMAKIKKWFSNNYNDLLYDTNGKIPWAVVQRLRRDLATWATGGANPFGIAVRDMILEVARSKGVSSKTAEEAWVEMGGEVFEID